MTDNVNEVPEAQPEESKTFTQEEVEQMLNEQVGGLKSKVEELLSEKKAAATKAKEAEEAARKEAEARLKEQGEFKALYESEQKQRAEVEERYANFESEIKSKSIDAEAKMIAATMTKDEQKQKVLVGLLKENIAYESGAIGYQLGGVELERDRLIEHFKTSYQFLVDGSPASGDRVATVGQKQAGGRAASKPFNKMSMSEKKAYMESKY